ncbi:Fusaridione A synthetase [Lachnellula willkommii]|uniref:Fusaridione A synthetase n=1 Tax=Lachnellula willkommii TaxID=215461 RepID=A0A559MF44_9HELO|nr:Fusaridione A synthetase [Lachnellula willkommii]
MPRSHEPIAVIGSANRFPGGCNTPSKLWELLRNPHDLLREIPKERFNIDAFYHPDPLHHGTTNTRHSYFLDEDPSKFDTQFFGIPPTEAESIDPQQRLLMETVYDSLCAAGLPLEQLKGTSTGVYVGLMCDDWSSMIQKDIDALPTYTGTGTARSIMSNRLSYFFDWHGPSMTVDTACSSSLVAVHEAVQLLRSGSSEIAIAAGANLILNPAQYVAESNLRMLSPTGRSRMWDASADGYARGEGIACIVLKTLSQAIADNDSIECVIRETGVNQDGRTSGLTVPSNIAQTNLIRDTYARAGLDLTRASDRPQLFHAHGTGTKAGDPQEAEAIHNAFFRDNIDHPSEKLYVHSIKTIIGHTEGTAGLASLIGTSLAIRNSTIPPNMHFNKLNPDIAPFYTHLQVPLIASDWPVLADGAIKRASVNSFGFGGTNAHAIIEEYIPETKVANVVLSPASPIFTPLLFSASSVTSLKSMLSDYLKFLTTNPQVSLRDLSWTLQHRQSTFSYRKAIAGRSYEDMCIKIADELEGGDSQNDTRSTNIEKPKILGVFTGQGAQWPRMAAELLEASPFVAQRIAELDASLASLPATDRPEWTIKEQLLADASSSRLAESALSQPLCTAVQVVMVDLLDRAGIKFKAVIGHSSGEIGAAYAAGFLSAHDAIRIAYYRGLLGKLASAPNKTSKGAMAAVGMTPDEATEFMETHRLKDRISVAAYNSSSSLTLSGDEDAIDEVIEILKVESKFGRRLKVDTAYHSAHMQTCAMPYLQAVIQCDIKALDTAVNRPQWFSSVTEDVTMTSERCDSQYWVNNMTQPVLFSSAINTAVEAIGSFDVAIEIGPHPALKGPAVDNLTESGLSVPYTGLLSRGKDDVEELSSALGFIWNSLGAGSVDFDTFDRFVNADNVIKTVIKDLPSYPFNHQYSYWAESRISIAYKQLKTRPNPILGMPSVSTTTSDEAQWRNRLSPKEIPWLQGHKLQGQIIFPATGYIVMAIEAVKTLAKDAGLRSIKIGNLVFERAIAFNDESATTETLFSVKLEDLGDVITGSFACFFSPEGDSSMIRNATGRIEVKLGKSEVDSLHFASPQNNFNMVDVSVEHFYKALSKIGYNYSAPFRGMSDIKRKLGIARGTLVDQSGSAWEDQLVLHPGMLDTALQTLFAAFSYPGDESLRSLHVPVSIDSIVINPYFSLSENRKILNVPWETIVRDDEKSHIKADVQLFSEDSRHTFAQIEGVSLKPFTVARPEDDTTLFSHFEYLRDSPDGESAAIGDRLSPDELRVARDMERLAFFYLRQVSEMPDEDRDRALRCHQHLMDWADYTVEKVRKEEHLSVGPECLNDTQEDILALTDKYRDRVDALLIESTGQNLPATIRAQESILQHMTKENLLGRFYEEGIGLNAANWWLANMVKQISHRYPHMKILEIGAGTGGTTQATLPSLGTSFSSYTYTDVSSGFFEAAENKFKTYADRMIFKIFDMVKSPAEQGFTEGSYDMVLASNVLHVAEDLDLMMTNVRKLLKPGGFLVNLETVTNDMLRNGIIMGGLPGWWIGAESGRPHGPMLDLESWDGLLKRSGFGGIQTSTPTYDSLHAVAVWAAQAVDDRVNILKSPLTALLNSRKSSSHLVVIGGNSFPTYPLLETIRSTLAVMFSSFEHVRSIEALEKASLPSGSTVLSLTDLDEPVMKNFTEGKMNSLKGLWTKARNILWVTKGARYDEPFSYMMFGIGRVVRFENPNINLQLLDIDSVNENVGQYIAEALLKHQLLDEWHKEGNVEDLLWSSEPEVFLEDTTTLIPRLYPNKAQNARLNSGRRKILKNVDPATTTLRLVDRENLVDIEEVTALETMASGSVNSIPERRIRIMQSLLKSVQVGNIGKLMLCVGIDQENPTSTILALTGESISPASIELACAVEIPKDPKFIQMALVAVAAHLVAQQVIANVPKGAILMVHEADKSLKAAISSKAKAAGLIAVFTTSLIRRSSDYTFIHPLLPTRLLKRQLMDNIYAFVDFSAKGSVSSEVGCAISNLLPEYCSSRDVASFFSSTPQLRPGTFITEAQTFLKEAWSDATESNVPIGEAGVISLSGVLTHTPAETSLTVVDWTASIVPVRVRPIDNNDIFRADRTYLLVGLSGEIGQSLCGWMVQHGARHVVLTSRKPTVDPDFIHSLESKGADIRAMALDITSKESLVRCLERIKRTMPKIAGISNGALIVADSPFNEMSLDEMTKVLKPKVDGSLLLDEIFHEEPLDFFIMFSSLTACLGNSGQSNYAAANMFMTTLAFQRRRRGVPGSVIDLSSLMGIGHVGRSDVFNSDYFRSLGATSVSETDLHQMFAEGIDVGRPDSSESAEVVTGISPMLRSELEDTKVQYRMDLKFSHFCIQESSNGGEASETSKVAVRIQLKSVKSRGEATKVLLESFTARVKKVLQIPADEVVYENEPLIERGVDSLVALDIRSWFMRELDVDMPVLKVLGGNSIADLIKDSIERIPTSILDTSALNDDFDVGAALQAAKRQSNSPPVDLKVPAADSADASSRGISTPTFSGAEDGLEFASSVDDVDIEDPSWHESILESSSEITESMSFGQTRFWFLHHALQDPTTFNVAISIRLNGRLQSDTFEKALNAVAEKHEAMRTRYFWAGKDNDIPTQGILSRSLIKLQRSVISSKSEADTALQEMRDYRWDLNNWESMRFVLLSLSENVHWFIFGCHHITIDGVGIQIIFSDLEKAYQGQRLVPLPEKSQYRMYSALQRQQFKDRQFQKDIDFYRNIIPSDVQPIALFPFSKLTARQPQTSYRTYRADIRLDASLTARIKQVARQNHATNFHLYLAVLQALLFRLLPETNELFVGIADANRNNDRFVETLGFFLNLIPIRFDRPSAKAKFGAAVKNARNKAYAALEHSALPFDILLNELCISRSANSPPIFQVFVDYRQGTQERANFATLDATGEEWYHPRTGYDISLDLLENAEGDTLVTLQLQQSLYTQEQTELLLRAYVNFLKVLTKTPGRDMPIDIPSVWADEDISNALEVGKGLSSPLRWPDTVSHRIDQMIKEHGSDPALKSGRSQSLTYNEMGRRVDSIARSLTNSGISNGAIVGVLQEPSPDWICSMLAIFRAGAIYLPLDLRNSIHRLRNAVQTAKPTSILVDPTTVDVVKTIDAGYANIIDISRIPVDASAQQKTTAAKGNDPAVILFTSGSTGEPKGVVIKHCNLVAQNEGFSKQFDIRNGKAPKCLQQSALSFDFSLEQTLVALCNGGCLYMVPPGKRGDPYEVTKIMLEEGINYTSGTPSEYEMWFQHGKKHLKQCHQWQYAFFGGEAFSIDFIGEFRRLELSALRVFNNYGPSETTIACTYQGEIQYHAENATYPLAAGFAAPNYALYIVDSQLNIQPLGMPGEILIGGCGVTAGYLGLEAATEERFVPNRFAKLDPNFAKNGWTTLYRTGDRGFLRDDGALVIEGRIDGDTQVKIRGFRVELAEIETVILNSAKDTLKHAVVTVRESKGAKFLAAHVVFWPHHSVEHCMDYLGNLQATLPLPEYMRPAVIVALEKLPLTAHSKFDRAAVKALPIENTTVSSQDTPRGRGLTSTEARLEEVWRNVLPFVPTTALTPEANFFHVGGNSLLLVRLQRIIKKEFSAALKLAELMNASRLEDMAAVITTNLSTTIDWDAETAIPTSWKDEFPPCAVQDTHGHGGHGLNVLLTGATGYLGRHLVPALIQSEQIAKIFCIVRRETDVETLMKASNKVVIFTGDLGEANLGLTMEEFNQLASESDVILHSGANRSFWDDYEVLRSANTHSLKELARLALTRRLPFHFVSSGSVRIYGTPQGAQIYNIDPSKEIANTPPEDGSDGYVASKWAAERILRAISTEFNLPLTLHTPMPVPDYGPDESHAEPESDHMLNELVEITLKLQVRPTMEGLGGWADILPVETVVDDILGAILKEPNRGGRGSRVFHTGIRRINWQRFITELQNNPLLNTLPSKDTLLWIGQAKRSGYSYFMPAHRLVVVGNEGDSDMVSRR